MRIIETISITDPDSLSGLDRNAFYNAHDVMLTYEIMLSQWREMDSVALSSFRFTFSLQRPALKMSLRGIGIDPNERAKMILILEAATEWTKKIISTYALAMWGKDLDPGSWQQKAMFIYDFLGLPIQTKYDKATKKSRPTTERGALEKLESLDHRATPIIKALLAYADARKALGVLRSGISSDGRMHSSFLVAATITARFASRQWVFRNEGMNLQNVREAWRSIFAADAGPLPNRESYNIPAEFRALPAVED